MRDRSLTLRILAASVSWIVATLVLTASLLVHLNWDHITRDYDAAILMHLEEMVEQSRLNENGTLERVPHPTDRRFDFPRSGWYWEVSNNGQVLARSASLGEEKLNLSGVANQEPGTVYEVTGPWGKQTRLQTLYRPVGPSEQHLYFVATAATDDIRAEMFAVAKLKAISFLALAAVLVIGVSLQLRFALRPLRDVSESLRRVRDGEAKQLEGRFPREVRSLVDELNNLIEHSAVVALRARNRLGDLAHSIKNPLTALNNEADNMDEERRAFVLEQTQHIQDSLKQYLARARVFGTDKVLGARTLVKPLMEDLVFLMRRVHAERRLEFDTSGLGGCGFRGDAQDAEEMFGNLLDNASKWASSLVRIKCRSSEQWLHVTIEDDGPGIAEDRIANVLKDGQRDASKPGQGRGLGIVRDIVEMYGGRLELDQSELGGLRAEVQLPGAWGSC